MFGHIDNGLLPEGCGSCHSGHGLSGEPMLVASEEEFCYQCHGDQQQQSAMKTAGKLAMGASLADIEEVFEKQYHHPVKEGTGHSPDERLPSMQAASVSHAECVDCHSPHERHKIREGQPRKVAGLSLSGQYVEEPTREYEVCLKCHVDPSGLSNKRGRNMAAAFSPSVVSQHPVTKPMVMRKSVSLLNAASAGSTMKCSDCHTNDDPNGPRGPHGSRYQFLLSGNYETEPKAIESAFAYEFCYSCHDRNSILDDDSFPLHSEHIEGDPLSGRSGTSCYTCHASHSSSTNAHLIEFNREAVTAERTTGRIAYMKTGDGRGQCYLSCHGHEHTPGKY